MHGGYEARVTQRLEAFNTNVLQCDTPLATYAHLAPCEPIAHPGRGMPVLSSTVHIARHAYLSWAQTIFCFLFHAPLHGAVVWQALWLAHGGTFWHQDMPRPVPLRSLQEGQPSGATPFVKIHDYSLLFTPTHLHGKIPNSTVFQGFAQWRIWRASVRGQWPWQCQHRPRDAVCARICNA